jgi:hypothetical protein
MTTPTDTPRTDACPHCGAEQQPISNRAGGMTHDGWICGTRRFLPENIRSTLCLEREARQKAEAEVERLKEMVIEAAELGDKRSENFKAAAEKAEASLIKINEELCHAGLRDQARKDLTKNLQTTGGIPWREWSAECAKETRRADENLARAEKAETDVERLRTALQSCYWATNTYDGNYTRACDNVATIAINALKTQDK